MNKSIGDIEVKRHSINKKRTKNIYYTYIIVHTNMKKDWARKVMDRKERHKLRYHDLSEDKL